MCLDMYRKSEFTIGKCKNCLGSGYVFVRDTTETCKECNGSGEIPKSSRQEFYDNISSFIEYPTIFLQDLSLIFKDEMESKDEIKRLIGLLKIDNLALDIGINDGIHPITGTKYNQDIENLYKSLKNRNDDMIKYLNGVLNVLETKY